MSNKRPRATPEKVEDAIAEIAAYHVKGRESLEDLPERGAYGDGHIDRWARREGWNPTKLRKARQFADAVHGYSPQRLDELYQLLRKHKPVFGLTHVGLLVTVGWHERGRLQRRCIQGNWSTNELQAEIKRRFGTRREGGRRRRVSRDRTGALVQLVVHCS